MYRITDPERSRRSTRRSGSRSPGTSTVRNGELETTNYFVSIGDQEWVLELTYSQDGRTYDLGTGYGHIAVGADDLDTTLARLREQGIEPSLRRDLQRPAARIRVTFDDPSSRHRRQSAMEAAGSTGAKIRSTKACFAGTATRLQPDFASLVDLASLEVLHNEIRGLGRRQIRHVNTQARTTRNRCVDVVLLQHSLEFRSVGELAMLLPIRLCDATNELFSRCEQLDEYDLSSMALKRIRDASHVRLVAKGKNERVDDIYPFFGCARDEVLTKPFDNVPKAGRAEFENLGDWIDRQVVVQDAKRTTLGELLRNRQLSNCRRAVKEQESRTIRLGH